MKGRTKNNIENCDSYKLIIGYNYGTSRWLLKPLVSSSNGAGKLKKRKFMAALRIFNAYSCRAIDEVKINSKY
jgi:hypothetical protein